jgi:hypothetical protein
MKAEGDTRPTDGPEESGPKSEPKDAERVSAPKEGDSIVVRAAEAGTATGVSVPQNDDELDKPASPPIEEPEAEASSSSEGTATPEGAIELPKRVTPEDITPPSIETGGTLTVVARHGVYDQSRGERRGKLTEEGFETVRRKAHDFFAKMIEDIKKQPDGRPEDLMILIFASDADFGPDTGQRCIHTAEAWEQGAIDALREAGLSENQILNPGSEFGVSVAGKIGVDHRISGDPYAVNEATTNYMEWLKERVKSEDRPELKEKFFENGSVKKNAHFIAYEMDVYKDERIQMGADGPIEVGEKLCKYLTEQRRLSAAIHAKYPGRYLAIINIAHTDNIEPLVKTSMSGHSPEDAVKSKVEVGHGGGFAYATHADGSSTRPVIGGRQYHVPNCA